MVHDLSIFDYELPTIEEWIAGDDRTLAYQVTDADENGVDISNADVTWRLFERAYQSDPADAVLSTADSDVTLVMDSRVDTSIGEFEVRVAGEATDALWGEFVQRPHVEQSDGTESSWRGDVILTA
jgi:hypothetical protein